MAVYFSDSQNLNRRVRLFSQSRTCRKTRFGRGRSGLPE